MTKIGKILAVFVAAFSLAFAGFAIATVFGGPDWQQMTNREYLKYYKFTRGGAPDYIWTATRLIDGAQVSTSKRLPEVITKVLDEVTQKYQQELQELKDREPNLQARVESLERAKAADAIGLDAYEARLRERLATARAQEADLSSKIIAATNEAQKLENETAVRREDVLRLQQTVAEIRADHFRLEEIRKQLDSILIQFQGDADRAKARQNSLKEQLQ
ncbi:MAG TPA: hypothetical protein VNQ76_12305 [Planctomicrobium sp.]|nr:hypothetical protein [Planctomicrobium sp.]